jgi:voltage-gated potassium channel
MSSATPVVRRHGNAYELFILVLTLLSLVVMALILLPLDQATLDTLIFYDNLICLVFLGDFLYNLTGSRPRRQYFIHERGWLDLLGSIPSLGILRFTGLLRLARLSRLARIMRLLTGQKKKELVTDIVKNRGQYAMFVTLTLVMLVLTSASVLMVQFESRNPDSNIKTGGDALWWAFTTITTVGYGDRFPVTTLGRSVAIMVMFAGIGVIGALASILASILVPTPSETAEAAAEAGPTVGASPVDLNPALADLRDELSATRTELAELRALLTARGVVGGEGFEPPKPAT